MLTIEVNGYRQAKEILDGLPDGASVDELARQAVLGSDHVCPLANINIS